MAVVSLSTVLHYCSDSSSCYYQHHTITIITIITILTILAILTIITILVIICSIIVVIIVSGPDQARSSFPAARRSESVKPAPHILRINTIEYRGLGRRV